MESAKNKETSNSAEAIYFNAIRKLGDNLLTAEEERELARTMASEVEGVGQEANQQMIESNLRLVIFIAKQYRGRGVELLDLIQAGNMGLMHGINKFNAELGFKISTYVSNWIRQAVQREIFQNGNLIYTPEEVTRNITSLEKARCQLHLKLNRQPTPEELAENLEISLEKTKDLICWQQQQSPLSLDKSLRPLAEEVDRRTLSDMVVDPEQLSPEEEVAKELLRGDLNDLINQLSQVEGLIIELFFGLNDSSSHSLQEIASILNISYETVRRTRQRALKKLFFLAESKSLQSYLSPE